MSGPFPYDFESEYNNEELNAMTNQDVDTEIEIEIGDGQEKFRHECVLV